MALQSILKVYCSENGFFFLVAKTKRVSPKQKELGLSSEQEQPAGAVSMAG
jgi:hypothetical protein